MKSSSLHTNAHLKLFPSFPLAGKEEEEEEEGEDESEQNAATLERILAFKLTDFLCSDVRYGLRRLLTADLKALYRGPDSGEEAEESKLRAHPTKGGRIVTPYLTLDW